MSETLDGIGGECTGTDGYVRVRFEKRRSVVIVVVVGGEITIHKFQR